MFIVNPSNFTSHPYSSITMNCENEVIARNIMRILKRTGDSWRELSWEEYREERLKDGEFTEREKSYFDRVAPYCVSPEKAREFCKNWGR